MKLKNFFTIVAAIGVFAACNPSYKATDKSKTSTDSTSVSTTGTPSTTVTVNVPEGTRTAFTTQYPTATNVVWVNYDTQAEFLLTGN